MLFALHGVAPSSSASNNSNNQSTSTSNSSSSLSLTCSSHSSGVDQQEQQHGMLTTSSSASSMPPLFDLKKPQPTQTSSRRHPDVIPNESSSSRSSSDVMANHNHCSSCMTPPPSTSCVSSLDHDEKKKSSRQPHRRGGGSFAGLRRTLSQKEALQRQQSSPSSLLDYTCTTTTSSSPTSRPFNSKLSLTPDQAATLQRVTRLAARMAGVPMAAISSWSSTQGEQDQGDRDPQLLAQYGLDDPSSQDQVLRILQGQTPYQEEEASSCSDLPYYHEHVPLITLCGSQRRVGTLTLLTSQARPGLTPEERESLDDLAFLATQVLENASNKETDDTVMTPISPPTPSKKADTSCISANKALPPAAPALPHIQRLSRKVSQNLNDDNDEEEHDDQVLKQTKRMTLRRASSPCPSPSSPSLSSHQPPKQQHLRLSSSTNVVAAAAAAAAATADPTDWIEEDPSKCIIACTAHDLLTPLMGLQLSLSLLQEDPKFVRHLEEQPLQRESFWTAWQSSEVMFRMCQTTIDTLRANKQQQQQQQQKLQRSQQQHPLHDVPTEVCQLDLTVLLESVQRLMDPIPKRVPLILTLDQQVPNQVPVITTATTPAAAGGTTATSPSVAAGAAAAAASDTVDWRILRCALTVLSHACRVSNSNSNEQKHRKPIQMRIYLEHGHGHDQSNGHLNQQRLVIECEHDCPDLDMDIDSMNASSMVADRRTLARRGSNEGVMAAAEQHACAHHYNTLALQSVAQQMSTVLGGQHGFGRPQMDQSRAIVWFSVPVSSGDMASITTTGSAFHGNRVITLPPSTDLISNDEGINNDNSSSSGDILDDGSMPDVSSASDSHQLSPSQSPVTLPPRAAKSPRPQRVARRRRMRNDAQCTPPIVALGPRRLRRSSTGSTNTLNRRRTFHDMAGLSDEMKDAPSAQHQKLNHFANAMFRCQSQGVGGLVSMAAGHRNQQTKNFQYPSSKNSNQKSRLSDPIRPLVDTRAAISSSPSESIIASAFQTGLASASTPLFPINDGNVRGIGCSGGGVFDSHLTSNNIDPSCMSYSILQESLQLQREQDQQQGKSLAAVPKRNVGNKSDSGLERCVEDVMGATRDGSSSLLMDDSNLSTTQRIRERLIAKPTTTAASSTTGKAESTGRERKALVIDDSLVIRKTVSRALTKLGIPTVVHACDGVEGLQRLKEEVFDVVLCDFSMPNMGGIDCVQKYRRWEREQPQGFRPRQYIVGMSAHANPADVAQGIKVGMNEYQAKPLTIPRLTGLLKSAPVEALRSQLDKHDEPDDMKTEPVVAAPVSCSSKVSAGDSLNGGLFADFMSTTASMLEDALDNSASSQTASSYAPAPLFSTSSPARSVV